MALICDICKVRPADARIMFKQGEGTRTIDVCRQDYLKMEGGAPFISLPGFEQSVNEAEADPHFSEASQQALERAVGVAGSVGSHQVLPEHLLMSLIDDGMVESLLSQFKIRTEDVRGYLEANMERQDKAPGLIGMGMVSRQLLSTAVRVSEDLGQDHIGPEHLLVALVNEDGLAGNLLRKYGLTEESLRQQIVKIGETSSDKESSETPQLDKYSRDLTVMAREGKLDPVIGRDHEVETAVEVLSRRTKNNPVLIGEPGVGKTAIVEGLAQRIVADEVPESLKGKRLVELSLSGLVSGTRYRGDFEERIKKVVDEIMAHKDKLLVFVDELHTVVGTGSSEGGLDAANLIKPALARGDLHLIGATTLNEYKKHIEKDAALERRFQSIMVNEPSPVDAVAILRGLKGNYEKFHGVNISDQAIEASVKLSDRYINDRFLPDKAIDLVDQASARVKIAQKRKEVMVSDIAEVVSRLTGVPVTELSEEERAKLLRLEEHLHQRVIGQDDAVEAVAKAVRISRTGLSSRQSPIASFLFLGPTGVGKTELAKTLAASMFGNEEALTRIDMSEYMERHAVARLIGSPPGYVGHDEGGQLTEAVRRRPYQVILLDEIEKAHPDVFNILLQLLDDGRLTDGKGRVVDFSNTIVIATSNIGSELHNRQAAIGFTTDDSEEQKEAEKVKDSLQQYFRPELINRLDEIIVFQSLTQEDVRKIVRLQLESLAQKLKEQEVGVVWDDSLVDYVAEAGFRPEYGAREMRRLIKREVEHALSTRLLEQKLKPGKKAKVSYKKEKGVLVA